MVEKDRSGQYRAEDGKQRLKRTRKIAAAGRKQPMHRKILLEDTPPAGDSGSHVLIALVIATVVWLVGATALHLAFSAL